MDKALAVKFFQNIPFSSKMLRFANFDDTIDETTTCSRRDESSGRLGASFCAARFLKVPS